MILGINESTASAWDAEFTHISFVRPELGFYFSFFYLDPSYTSMDKLAKHIATHKIVFI